MNELLQLLDALFEQPKAKSDIKSATFNEKKGITTVVLQDGKVGIAKAANGDVYDKKVGFALAYCYAKMGSKTQFNKIVNKYEVRSK